MYIYIKKLAYKKAYFTSFLNKYSHLLTEDIAKRMIRDQTQEH
jgi:hypothetical protein